MARQRALVHFSCHYGMRIRSNVLMRTHWVKVLGRREEKKGRQREGCHEDLEDGEFYRVFLGLGRGERECFVLLTLPFIHMTTAASQYIALMLYQKLTAVVVLLMGFSTFILY